MTETLDHAIRPDPEQVRAYESKRAVGAKRRLDAGSSPLGQQDPGKAANWTEDQLIALVKEAKSAPEQWFPFSQHLSEVSARTRTYQLNRGSVKKYDGIPLEFSAMASSDGGNWIWVKWSPNVISKEWARKIGDEAPAERVRIVGVDALEERLDAMSQALETLLELAVSPAQGKPQFGCDARHAPLGSVALGEDGAVYVRTTHRNGPSWGRVVLQEGGPSWLFPQDLDLGTLTVVAEGDGVVSAGADWLEDEF